MSFNGLRNGHNIYLLDGGEDDDRGGAGAMSIAPSSDAIAEFRALTSNYSADYGLSSAGTMTMVLKSGSSTIHAGGNTPRDSISPRPAGETSPLRVASRSEKSRATSYQSSTADVSALSALTTSGATVSLVNRTPTDG